MLIRAWPDVKTKHLNEFSIWLENGAVEELKTIFSEIVTAMEKIPWDSSIGSRIDDELDLQLKVLINKYQMKVLLSSSELSLKILFLSSHFPSRLRPFPTPRPSLPPSFLRLLLLRWRWCGRRRIPGSPTGWSGEPIVNSVQYIYFFYRKLLKITKRLLLYVTR